MKTLSDADRGLVRLTPQRETVENLVSIERPTVLPDDERAPPVETTIYEVEARLLLIRLENDGDYHIVIGGLRDSSATMITEAPNPECGGVCNSGLGERYAAVRTYLERWLQQGVQGTPVVVVTGVGFWDSEHGQTGVAPNNIEPHPVLKLTIRH